jgi:O-acetylserine/cysteine efflux transporter
MPVSHLLLALAVVAVWGTNFVVIRWALLELPPFTLAALRFALSAWPLVMFLPRPAVPWRALAAFGVLLGVGQFGLLFLAMRSDIAPGLASLVVQTQVLFTLALAWALRGERLRRVQVPGLLLAVAGMVWIGLNAAGGGQAVGQGSVSPLGLGLVLAAALCWAGANLVARAAGRVDALAFMAWSSLFAVPPLVLLAGLMDGGPALVQQALLQASPRAWAAVAWQALGNTLFGYAAWNWLLARHAPGTVTPTALLVPVFGMASAAVWLGEPLPAWKLGAAALVLGGLLWNLWVSRPAAGPAR